MKKSTTVIMYGIGNNWSDNKPVFEIECFVADNGTVIPVPSKEYNYTGYAQIPGLDIFKTKEEAIIVGILRSEIDVKNYKRGLEKAENRLAQLLKEKAQ